MIYKINLINYHDQSENIPIHQNCLFVSSSDTIETSKRDYFAHTKFNEFFSTGEFTLEQIARFIDWSVKTSTPHISGYYHGTAVGPCKICEFIAELDNPASNINQNIIIEHLLDDLVSKVTQTNDIENLLADMTNNISGEIFPDIL